MTASEIGQKLAGKYPTYLKGDEDEYRDIMALFNRLQADDVDKVWTEFRSTYQFATAPRLAVFVKAVKDSGAKYRASEVVFQWEYVCYVCGSRFALGVAGCPKCTNGDKAWLAVIKVGGYRGGKLKHEDEAEREQNRKDRLGER